ncbi:MAG: iron-containing alcohol dehydrogenase [Candidatus Omnitrophica bacterium]|nr:iron-containing alcohol dehydrogenase [Candidatus Omnitrophota bacterium]
MSCNTTPFDYRPMTRVVYGPNAIERIGSLTAELRAGKVLVVTDPGIVKAGHLDRVRESLEASTLEVFVFQDVVENPTTKEVYECAEFAREKKIDTLVGLGGGSSLDTARGANFILTNGGEMKDYWGYGKAMQPLIPMVAVPTTAGTGSECQSFALIADAETHQKMACGDPKAAAHVALLDPTLTLTQPREVTAHTGIDAITHAIETAVTKKKNGISTVYSRRAFQLTIANYPKVLQDSKDLEARGAMLQGASFAGLAIENSMIGAAHSAANPLFAHHNVVHGEGVGLMLPAVIRFNGRDEEAAGIYRELALMAGLVTPDDAPEVAVEALASQIEDYLRLADLPTRLSDYDIPEEEIDALAEEAAKQWTAQFNPREVRKEDFGHLYRSVYA